MRALCWDYTAFPAPWESAHYEAWLLPGFGSEVSILSVSVNNRYFQEHDVRDVDQLLLSYKRWDECTILVLKTMKDTPHI